MNAEQPGAWLFHPLERFLTIFGAVACAAITLVIWRNVSSYQGMWPLPAFYFIEVTTLSVLSAFITLRGAAFAGTLMWGTSGVLGTFCLLGMFSVGAIYLPIAIIFAAASIAADVHDSKRFPRHLMVFVLAGIAQAALMLTVVKWPSTGVGF